MISTFKDGGGLEPSTAPNLSPWNQVEPCSSADIRQLKINYLPGKSQDFSENIGVLCLLQAAQIQRLTTSLQQYQKKLLQMEKSQYLRWSYEAQIKELTEKLKKAIQNETQQKDFIKKTNNASEVLLEKTIVNTQKLNKIIQKEWSLDTQNEELKNYINNLEKQNKSLKQNFSREKIDEVPAIYQGYNVKVKGQLQNRKQNCIDLDEKLCDLQKQYVSNQTEMLKLQEEYKAKVNQIKKQYQNQKKKQTLREKKKVQQYQLLDQKRKGYIQKLETLLHEQQRKNIDLSKQINFNQKKFEREKKLQIQKNIKYVELLRKEEIKYKRNQEALEKKIQSLHLIKDSLRNESEIQQNQINRLNKQLCEIEVRNTVLKEKVEFEKKLQISEKVKNSKLQDSQKILKIYNLELKQQIAELEENLQKILEEVEEKQKKDKLETEKRIIHKKMIRNSQVQAQMIEEAKEEFFSLEIQELQQKLGECNSQVQVLRKTVAHLQESIQNKSIEFNEILKQKDIQINQDLQKKDMKMHEIIQSKQALNQKVSSLNASIQKISEELQSFKRQNRMLKSNNEKANSMIKMMSGSNTQLELLSQIKDEMYEGQIERLEKQMVRENLEKNNLHKKGSQLEEQLSRKDQLIRQKDIQIISLAQQIRFLEITLKKMKSKIVELRNYNIEVEEEVTEMQHVIEEILQIVSFQQIEKKIKIEKNIIHQNLLKGVLAETDLMKSLLEDNYIEIEEEFYKLKQHFSIQFEKISEELDQEAIKNNRLQQKISKQSFQLKSLQNYNIQLNDENKNAFTLYEVQIAELNELISSYEYKLAEEQKDKLFLQRQNATLIKQIESWKYPCRKSQSVDFKRQEIDVQNYPSSDNSVKKHHLKKTNEYSGVPFPKNVLYPSNKSKCFQEEFDFVESQEEFQKRLEQENQTLKDQINTKNEKITEAQSLYKQKEERFNEINELYEIAEKKLEKKQLQCQLLKGQVLMLKQYIEEQNAQVQRKIKFYEQEFIEVSTVGGNNERCNSIEGSFLIHLEEVEKDRNKYENEVINLEKKIQSLWREKNQQKYNFLKQIDLMVALDKEKQLKIDRLEQQKKVLQKSISLLQQQKQQLHIEIEKSDEQRIKSQSQTEKMKILLQKLSQQIDQIKEDQDRVLLINQIKELQTEFEKLAEDPKKKSYKEIEQQMFPLATATKLLTRPAETIKNSDLCKSIKKMRDQFTSTLKHKQIEINELQYSIYQKDSEHQQFLKKNEENRMNIDQQKHQFQRGIFLLQEQMVRLQQALEIEQKRNAELQQIKQQIQNENQSNLRRAKKFQSQLIEVKTRQFLIQQENYLNQEKFNDLCKKLQECEKQLYLRENHINQLRENIQQQSNKLCIEKQNSKFLHKKVEFLSQKIQQKSNLSSEELIQLCTQLESQIQKDKKQIDRFRVLIQIKQQQIIKLKGDIQKEKKKTGKEHQKLLTSNYYMIEELKKQKKIASESQARVTTLFDQFDRLQKIIDSLKRERAEHISKNHNLLIQLGIRDKVTKGLQAQIDNLNLDLTTKFQLERKQKQLLHTIMVICVEMQSLRQLVNQKDSEIQKLTSKIPHPYRI